MTLVESALTTIQSDFATMLCFEHRITLSSLPVPINGGWGNGNGTACFNMLAAINALVGSLWFKKGIRLTACEKNWLFDTGLRWVFLDLWGFELFNKHGGLLFNSCSLVDILYFFFS